MMTFDDAIAEMTAKLPADVEFELRRRVRRRTDGSIEDYFALSVERRYELERTFDVRRGSLRAAVAAAIDFVRGVEARRAEEAIEQGESGKVEFDGIPF